MCGLFEGEIPKMIDKEVEIMRRRSLGIQIERLEEVEKRLLG